MINYTEKSIEKRVLTIESDITMILSVFFCAIYVFKGGCQSRNFNEISFITAPALFDFLCVEALP